MQFYTFRSPSGASAITVDPTGANLPPGAGAWVYVRDLRLVEGLSSPPGMPVIEALSELDRAGYYMVPPRAELDSDSA